MTAIILPNDLQKAEYAEPPHKHEIAEILTNEMRSPGELICTGADRRDLHVTYHALSASPHLAPASPECRMGPDPYRASLS